MPAREPKLDRELWLEFLDELGIAEQRLTESQQRAYFRWRCEGVAPQYHTGDRFLIHVFGLPITFFINWCDTRPVRSKSAPTVAAR